MRLSFFLCLFFLSPGFVFGQFPISPNKLDANGKRTGHWTILYDSTFKRELKNPDSVRYYRLLKYEAGKPVGKVRDFYRTGRKQWEANVISINPDLVDGESISYHENGKVKYKSNYIKGKAEGAYDEYSVNGKLLIHGTMKEDSAVGKWNYYKEDGFRWAELEKLGNQTDFWITYHPNGQIQKKGLIIKNLMEGQWLSYYENGRPNSKSFYKNGLLNGPWEWYNKEGTLEETGTYLNDNKFGNWTVYNDGGKTLLKQGAYDSAGKESGHWVYYYTNGVKKSEGQMVKGSNMGNWKFYYEDGTLKTEGALLRGLFEGEIKTYHPSGKLESVAFYEQDTIHGEYTGYFENGNIQAKGIKVHGLKNGLWIYNFQSGSLDGTQDLLLGILNGKSVNYYEDGTVEDETIYFNGKRNGLFTSYYANKKVAVKGMYEMEKRTGEWAWYFENGQLDERFIYKEGLSEGIYFKNYPNGIKRAEGVTLHGKLTGHTKYYFSNGQRKSDGNNVEGQSEGIWTFYDSLTGKRTSQGLLVKDKHHGKWNYWTPDGKKKQPKYYVMDWQEEPYNIRDSVNKLSDIGQYDKAWAAVGWAKKVIRREYPKEHKSYALPSYLYGYILLYGKKQAQKALPFFEEHLEKVEKYEGRQSDNYFSALNNLANAYSAIGQSDKALAMQDSILALTSKDSIRAKYNTYLYNKAGTLYDLGKKQEAENLFIEEINYQQSQSDNYANVYDIRQKHGEFYFGYAYDYEKSILLFKELYTDILKKDPKGKRLLYCAQKIAYSNNYFSRRKQTIAWLKTAISHAEELSAPNFNDYFQNLDLLANNYIGINFLDSANQVYNKMNSELVQRNLLNTVAHSMLLDGKAEIYFKNYQNQEALALWTQAKEILERINETKTTLYASELQAMALVYDALEKYTEAENVYLQALQLNKELNGGTSRSYIQSAIELAGIYENMSAYEKGEALLNEVLKAIGESPAVYNLSNQANAMRKLASIKSDLSNYNAAIEYLQKALHYFEENRSNDPLTLANALAETSFNFRKLGNYESAEKYLFNAIAVIEEFFGKEGTTYLSYQSSLAHYYNERQLYSDAINIFQNVLKGYEKLSGKNSSRYVLALRNLASCYFDQGEYQKAEPLYMQTLDLAQALEGGMSYDYSDALYKLAAINFNLGKNKVSENFYLQYTIIEKQKYGVRHPEYAFALKELAIFYFNTNRLSESEPLMTEATAIIGESAYGKSSKIYSRYILSLGKIFSARDKNKEAEEVLLKAVAITGANKVDFYFDYLNAVEGLAEFYEKLGQYNSVEKIRKEVIDLTEKRTGKDLNYATKNLKLLGLYYESGKYESAISLGNELLGYFENELARDHYLILDLHNIMGLTELKLRRFEAAASHFNYCIEMRDLNGTQKSDAYTTYLNNLSLTTVAKGDFVATETLLNKAASIRNELGIKLNPRTYALITDNYAGLYQAWGKLDKAEKYWIDVIQKLVGYTRENFYFMSDEEKSQFWNDIKEDFEYFNSFAVLRAQQNPTILGEMYNNQLATKAILLSATNKIKKRILSSGDTVMVNNYYHWVETRERLAQLYTSSDSELKNKKPQVDSLALLAKKIEKELNISSEDLAHDKGAQSKMTSWKEVQRALTSNEAAIEIIRFRYFDRYLRDSVIYAALVLTAETKLNPLLVVLPNGKLLEGRAMKYYKNAIAAKIEDKFSYNYFWASIEPLVKNKTRIYLSLDGVYNQINLNTLADPNGKFLVESKNLTILSNTKDLLLLRSKRTSRYGATTASLFGYPKYFIGKERMKEKITKQIRDFDFAMLDERDVTGIAALPGTQTEIAQVKNVLTSHQWQTNDYIDESASEKTLKSIDYPGVLHIATHGFFVDDQETSATFKVGAGAEYAKQNPLLRSGLLLSGAANFIQNNVRLEEENGILTAYEAANLNLDNTELVVLSACETGKGEVQNGEGVYGLQRAFQTAGAQAIIMSLWKVDDEATQELMTAFYQNWMGGMAKAQAFRQAQLQLKKKYTNPYYWGAFVMMEN